MVCSVLRQRGGPRGVGVPERVRFGDDFILEHLDVPRGRGPVPMRGFLVQHQKERFVLRARLEPLEAEVGGDVRAVALDGELASGDEEHGIPIRPLTGQDNPAVETSRVAAEVPLANHARVIAAGLKAFRHMVARAVEAVEDGHAVEVRILPGQQRGAAGRADGIGDE